MDTQPAEGRRLYSSDNNRFGLVSLWCGIIGICCAFTPLFVIVPILCILGFLSGIVALVMIYQPASRYENASQAWVGCSLCLLTFGVTGILFTALMGYVQMAQSTANQRNIAFTLQYYVEEHNGSLPSSLAELALPTQTFFCRQYYFYPFYKTSPYIFNGYLAGKDISSFAYPERTVIIAEGTDLHAKVFFTASDLNLRAHRLVTFLDGHVEYQPENFAKHFPSNGNISDDSWFIKPILKTMQKR